MLKLCIDQLLLQVKKAHRVFSCKLTLGLIIALLVHLCKDMDQQAGALGDVVRATKV